IFPVDVIQENYVRNEILENILDLDISVKGSPDFLEFVSGGKVAFGSVPLAHRNGDGRAVLRSSLREFLCSEAMHYLGIPTSRAASLFVSDDDVWRDQFYNGNIKKERGAIVLRLAKSWFRIGSLEILAHSGELDLLRFELNLHIVSETANLISLWMSVGFAHGVCNTDNFSLLSITIDYGPFGFMDSYDPNFVPNTSDDERRYKIGNQASVGLFNLSKLLQALKPLLDPRQKQLASQVLEGYGEHYYSRFTELFKTKLGLLGENENDNYLIAFLLKEFWALQDLAKHKLFSEWVTMYLLRLNSNNGDSDAKRRTRMASRYKDIVQPLKYTMKIYQAEGIMRDGRDAERFSLHHVAKVTTSREM
ncbi:hypothetical protein IHE44_0000179, partial [Lamprotornis superbus]